MDTISVGCVGFTGPDDRYWADFDAAELPTALYAWKPVTLARRRNQAPPHARLVVPADVGLARAGFVGDAAAESWARTIAAAEVVAADAILMRTPSGFRPTAANQRALSDFFGGREAPCPVAWWAEGLWEDHEDAQLEICTATGLTPVIDPLAPDAEDPPPDSGFFYWRLMGGAGMSCRFSDHQLRTVLERCESRAAGIIMFGTGTMVPSARALRAWIADVGPPAAAIADAPDEPDVD